MAKKNTNTAKRKATTKKADAKAAAERKPLSDEHKAKISAALKGKVVPWNKGKKTGIKPWNAGVKTGIEPWNKGKKTGIEPANKGKKTAKKAASSK